MNQGIARKLGMTQMFDEEGNSISVTVLQADPLTVVQKKAKEADGYEAAQMGFLPVKENRVNRPLSGHFKKHGVKSFRFLREIRLPGLAELKTGQELKVSDLFKVGEFVDVTGVSKGKGFQGGMKRHNFGGGPASHGSMSHRRPAAGGETNSAKVYRGKRSPGHMGDRQVTVQGMEIVQMNPEQNLLLIKGGVPGSKDSLLFLRTSIKSEGKLRKKETAKAAALKQKPESPEKEKKKGKK